MTITWSEPQRLHLIRIIADRMLDTGYVFPGQGEVELIAALSGSPARFLENNRDKFADAIAEYEKENTR